MARPSSAPEQSMPWLSVPWIVETPMRLSPGVPHRAVPLARVDRLRCCGRRRRSGSGVSATRDADLGQVEPVGVRVWHDLDQLADDDGVPIGADVLDRPALSSPSSVRLPWAKMDALDDRIRLEEHQVLPDTQVEHGAIVAWPGDDRAISVQGPGEALDEFELFHWF